VRAEEFGSATVLTEDSSAPAHPTRSCGHDNERPSAVAIGYAARVRPTVAPSRFRVSPSADKSAVVAYPEHRYSSSHPAVTASENRRRIRRDRHTWRVLFSCCTPFGAFIIIRVHAPCPPVVSSGRINAWRDKTARVDGTGETSTSRIRVTTAGVEDVKWTEIGSWTVQKQCVETGKL